LLSSLQCVALQLPIIAGKYRILPSTLTRNYKKKLLYPCVDLRNLLPTVGRSACLWTVRTFQPALVLSGVISINVLQKSQKSTHARTFRLPVEHSRIILLSPGGRGGEGERKKRGGREGRRGGKGSLVEVQWEASR